MSERNFINGYYLLEADLKESFTFVEPVEKNFETFSQRFYALLIRACIEFEAFCKDILKENKYHPVSNSKKKICNYNITITTLYIHMTILKR